MHAFSHAEIHATRTAEAAAWRRAREAAPHLRPLPSCALRNRLGEALIVVGIRLIQPAHLHRRITRPYGGAA
ncbi:hypothetical protein OG389_14545 [Streptomyces sp. NBC_00435]|uniref:hypothetical protein n=1 Tax=Streptomyces sp. NBC_00435 TaxID=2903649 RepID=UPI002E1B928C